MRRAVRGQTNCGSLGVLFLGAALLAGITSAPLSVAAAQGVGAPAQVFQVQGYDLPRSERVKAFLEHWQRRRFEGKGIQPLLGGLDIKTGSDEEAVILGALSEVGSLVALPKFDNQLTGSAFVDDQITRYVAKARGEGRIWCQLLARLSALGNAGARVESLMEKMGAGLSLASEDPPELWKGIIEAGSAFDEAFVDCQRRGGGR